MREVLVDTNVILDVLTEDPTWAAWSSARLAELAENHTLIVNPIIYGEVAVGYETIDALDAALPAASFRREPMPWEAAFLAGKAFARYRRAGGPWRSLLPDFFIGAHAALRGLPVLTRDPRRYRTYFPALKPITP